MVGRVRTLGCVLTTAMHFLIFLKRRRQEEAQGLQFSSLVQALLSTRVAGIQEAEGTISYLGFLPVSLMYRSYRMAGALWLTVIQYWLIK